MSDEEKQKNAEAAEAAGGKVDAAAAENKNGEPVPETPSAEKELATTKDRLLRLQADFDNYRKRTLREKSEWSVTANENIVSELIPVLDHFELGLKTAVEHKTEKSVHDGFQMVYDQMLASLRRFGLTPLDVTGSGFDAVHHEAVAHVPSEEYPADEIIAQTRRGWKLGDKLLRPVQVVVSSGPGAPRDDEMKGGDAAATDEKKASS